MAALSSVRSNKSNKTQIDQLALWNSKNDCVAPLSEKQIDSFHQLALLSRNLPMPSEVTAVCQAIHLYTVDSLKLYLEAYFDPSLIMFAVISAIVLYLNMGQIDDVWY